jgi:acetyltransferase
VAIIRQSGALIGVVRVVADPDYTRGEYAILLRSDLKGHGLGWRLMQHLIAYARSEKLAELHGSVLTGNTTMLQMCRELGFSIEREPGDEGIRRVILSLTEPGP